MEYSQRIKNEVLDQLNKGNTVAAVSQMYGIAPTTLYKWRKASKESPNGNNKPHRYYDLEKKIEVLRLAESRSLSYRQIARLAHVGRTAATKWIKDKNHILALYSPQEQNLSPTGKATSSREETAAMSRSDDKDTRQHIHDLQVENEFLKARIAYLEALMELNGTPASGFKKKRNTRPSTKSSEEGSET